MGAKLCREVARRCGWNEVKKPKQKEIEGSEFLG
jgi:hypothetical protein